MVGMTLCSYYISDYRKNMIITFNAALPKKRIPTFNDIIEYGRKPWGYEYVKKLGYNVISFMPIGKLNWYRNKAFHRYLEKLGKELARYPAQVYGYGGSMGGYGVSAFSEALSMDKMLIMNPFSTLSRELVPEETRFVRKAEELNWGESYHDGAVTNVPGYIIYDPIFHLDNVQAKRYKSLRHFKLPGVGHRIPVHLQKLGMLGWISRSFFETGTIDEKRFYEEARRRREYEGYYKWMKSEKNTHLTEKRRDVIEKYQRELIR